MHDGIVRMHTNVRHVLDLKIILISFCILEALRCSKYTATNGIVNISKCALVVVKACRSNGLYILQGFIVTCLVVVSSPSLSDSDITKL